MHESETGDKQLFMNNALVVAPRLLGGILRVSSDTGAVAVRVTEVEAYLGLGTGHVHDPGSHARMGKTKRNASMFGPPAHAYVYFTYGMHYAINVVCSPDGEASGVLLRAGEVIEGIELARLRRGTPKRDIDLARGPGRLAQALGVQRETHDGLSLFADPFEFSIPQSADESRIRTGPRVGVSGVAGTQEFPWRFWLADEPTVSAYRRAKSRKART